MRHAEAEGNVKQIYHGWADSDLTEKGLEQAKKVANRLKTVDVDIIYSSGLTRANKTAKFIADEKELDIHINENLREINGGDWENLTFKEIAEVWPEQSDYFNFDIHLLSAPNGETFQQFYDRLVDVINQIIKDNSDKNICVVTHGTAIRALLCYFYSKPLDQVTKIMWGENTSVSIITINEDKYTVEVESDASHLDCDLCTVANQIWWNEYKEKLKEE